MELNIKQTKLVGLIMKLDLKTKEYNMLCEKLNKLKDNKIGENDEILIDLKKEFLENNREIVEIKNQIKELKNIQENETKKLKEKHNYDEMFKKVEDIKESTQEELTIIENNSFLKRTFWKIRKFFMNLKNKR